MFYQTKDDEMAGKIARAIEATGLMFFDSCVLEEFNLCGCAEEKLKEIRQEVVEEPLLHLNIVLFLNKEACLDLQHLCDMWDLGQFDDSEFGDRVCFYLVMEPDTDAFVSSRVLYKPLVEKAEILLLPEKSDGKEAAYYMMRTILQQRLEITLQTEEKLQDKAEQIRLLLTGTDRRTAFQRSCRELSGRDEYLLSMKEAYQGCNEADTKSQLLLLYAIFQYADTTTHACQAQLYCMQHLLRESQVGLPVSTEAVALAQICVVCNLISRYLMAGEDGSQVN